MIRLKFYFINLQIFPLSLVYNLPKFRRNSNSSYTLHLPRISQSSPPPRITRNAPSIPASHEIRPPSQNLVKLPRAPQIPHYIFVYSRSYRHKLSSKLLAMEIKNLLLSLFLLLSISNIAFAVSFFFFNFSYEHY